MQQNSIWPVWQRTEKFGAQIQYISNTENRVTYNNGYHLAPVRIIIACLTLLFFILSYQEALSRHLVQNTNHSLIPDTSARRPMRYA